MVCIWLYFSLSCFISMCFCSPYYFYYIYLVYPYALLHHRRRVIRPKLSLSICMLVCLPKQFIRYHVHSLLVFICMRLRTPTPKFCCMEMFFFSSYNLNEMQQQQQQQQWRKKHTKRQTRTGIANKGAHSHQHIAMIRWQKEK